MRRLLREANPGSRAYVTIMHEYSAFETAYAREVPPLLKALYANRALLESAPVRLTLRNKPFVLEIQYFRSIDEIDQRNVRRNWFAFAVNTDGRDMLVDLADVELPILQDESGQVDCIQVTLAELLVASPEQIR